MSIILNYPRYLKGNAYVERFNRSLQKDFIDYREEELREDIEGFNREPMDYLIYNTERIHSGIGGKAPLRYFCENFLNQAESKKIWSYTIQKQKELIYGIKKAGGKI